MGGEGREGRGRREIESSRKFSQIGSRMTSMLHGHPTAHNNIVCTHLFQTKSAADNGQVTPPATPTGGDGDSLGLTDEQRVKKVRNLKKTLQQIEKLKAQRAAGKTLEVNQREKVDRETEIVREISQLQI